MRRVPKRYFRWNCDYARTASTLPTASILYKVLEWCRYKNHTNQTLPLVSRTIGMVAARRLSMPCNPMMQSYHLSNEQYTCQIHMCWLWSIERLEVISLGSSRTHGRYTLLLTSWVGERTAQWCFVRGLILHHHLNNAWLRLWLTCRSG